MGRQRVWTPTKPPLVSQSTETRRFLVFDLFIQWRLARTHSSIRGGREWSLCWLPYIGYGRRILLRKWLKAKVSNSYIEHRWLCSGILLLGHASIMSVQFVLAVHM